MSFISCGGHVIHYSYLDNKKAATFLFINSLGTDFRIWEDVAEGLKEYGNILLYDKRGHGLSDVAKAEHGLEDHAEDAYCLMESLAIKNCIVVGISVGGMIAPILAHHHPHEVKKLILCGSANRVGNTVMWNERIQHIRSNGLAAITGPLMKRWLSPSFHAKYPERVAGYKNMVERCSEEGYIQTCEAIRDADIMAISRSIKIPTLCIVGSEDQSVAPADVRSLSQSIKDSKFEIVNGSHHMVCIDNKDVFTKLIIDFVASNAD